MAEQRESLNETATVKGTMLRAHLAWVSERLGDPAEVLGPLLTPRTAPLVKDVVLATQWVPFRSVIEIDRAIAEKAGGPPIMTFLELGRYSALLNLEGVYKSFVSAEPHRFFDKSALLHDRFQNFGKAVYEKLGERSGRMRMEEYPVYSPVYCATGRGYFEEALRLMHVPGLPNVQETSCLCEGGTACVFDMSW